MPDDKVKDEKTPPADDKGAPPSDKAPEAKRKEGEDFNPAPDHPRFKEVYFRMKKTERELEEHRKDMEALRVHNQQMAQALEESARTRKPEVPEPDPAADPEGYKAWHQHQMARKDKEYQDRLAKERTATLVEIESGLHEDYDEAVKIAEREMSRDPALKKKVWDSPNPARAAYKLGRKHMDDLAAKDKEEQERQERLDAGDVHKDTPPPPAAKDSVDELTADEKRVIRNLFPEMEFKEAAKKYADQKKLMAGAGR